VVCLSDQAIAMLVVALMVLIAKQGDGSAAACYNLLNQGAED
jgi:hypothetical protein